MADVEDIPALLVMAQAFIEQAYGRASVPYDEASCRDLLTGLIEQEGGILLTNLDRTGMLGVVVHPWHFNRNIKTATELFWWGKDALEMHTRAEEMAFELGAATMHMASQEHMRSKALCRLYRMRGYELSENIYIKRIA